MHPRSSFKAFLEVVKRRSVPWEDVEMDVIHSLQLILRGSLPDETVDNSKVLVKGPSVDDRIQRVDELRIVTNEMVRLIETAAVPILAVDASGNINGWNTKASELTELAVEKAIGDYIGIVRSPSALIPPIFMTDENFRCLEWNDAMQKVSGLRREEAVERMLVGEVFTEQLSKIVDDTDIESIEECYMEMSSSEFNLGEAVEVVMNQVRILSQERQVEVIHDSPAESNSEEGTYRMKMHIVHLEFRIIHPAPGIPEDLIQEMFHSSHRASKEGLGLHLSQNLVKIMSGTVQYQREEDRSSFIILIEFPLVHQIGR
ncbi:phytochrome C isoform X1 [Prunus yedoensis var. nudiflora]|uniref:Phytochrome C isoform X1 n=1 Tax=Prunus yedoensis var. nudiflora TaxID=2094558 RepID=A0A314ZQW9_PRUYE|nr:phytochrome C isoform X1 [Prunus yedoensis var. nudiflora]